MHLCIMLPSLLVRTQVGSRLSVTKSVKGARWPRQAMGTLAERALLAAGRHMADTGATWPNGRVRDHEEPRAWNRMTMSNRRLVCRVSSYHIWQFYDRTRHGSGTSPTFVWSHLAAQILGDFAGESSHVPSALFADLAEDSDEPWHDSSSNSSSPTWYERKTGLHGLREQESKSNDKT